MIDGLVRPSELPKSTMNLTDEPPVYKEASAIPKMRNEVSPVTEHLERVNVTLMGEIPTDRAQVASLRTSLFKLANSADIPLPRREIFNQIGYEINDLAHKYNSSKEMYDHSSFGLKRLRELQETKSAFQAFYILSFEAERQATLRLCLD
ncbi:hypothetical protein L195_g037528 [Trifolium pratense]|uniref:Uncharacterized protein n=1 Tax=Trifolium pratense TaxID=57577 RepID=A0A2K3LSI7_TRIPR|nr:hypothetical protein L195_g037528 [Trifolium pratense]